jgi:hypothetical protein
MKKLEQFINNDLKYFSNLGNSEVEQYDANNIDNDIVEYLKAAKRQRFDYKDICVYYVEEVLISKDISEYKNEIWVENMNS